MYVVRPNLNGTDTELFCNLLAYLSLILLKISSAKWQIASVESGFLKKQKKGGNYFLLDRR